MRLLAIEDDPMIGESLGKALKADGYAIDWAKDGLEGWEAVQSQAYDLILLDLGLPGMDGVSFLQKLRACKNDLPVLIITARDSVQDRVLGLDSGADDYLVKPFSLEELEARIRSLLRRRGNSRHSVMSSGDAALDTISKRLSYRGKNEILSAKEYALMVALMTTPGSVFSRAQLEETLYGWNEEIGSNAVEVHIHQLRKKFGKDVIRNIRGLGYMVSP
jgi:two-component system, OmpR family, response regulator QseB